MSLQKFIDKAKDNRQKFLEPYREKFETAKTRRARAKIIIELIKAEPSHLDEIWIRREVEKWLLDPACRDYLDAIKPPTEKQKLNEIRDGMIFNRVEKLRKQGKSVNKACQKLALEVYGRDGKEWLGITGIDKDMELDNKIYKIYYREKKRREKQLKPYYGRDIRINPRG